MKIFGKHNTKAVSEKLTHQVAKIFLDKANGSFNINQKLLELLGIKRGDDGYVIFIEDKGKIGVAYTNDITIGLRVFWYKRDSRARMFNATMVEYFVEKYKLKNEANSYHIEFNQIPVKVEKYDVYTVKEVTPYNRQKPGK